ncbi:9427_t:CDS:1, partial [Racocetra fulgida]
PKYHNHTNENTCQSDSTNDRSHLYDVDTNDKDVFIITIECQ